MNYSTYIYNSLNLLSFLLQLHFRSYLTFALHSYISKSLVVNQKTWAVETSGGARSLPREPPGGRRDTRPRLITGPGTGRQAVRGARAQGHQGSSQELTRWGLNLSSRGVAGEEGEQCLHPVVRQCARLDLGPYSQPWNISPLSPIFDTLLAGVLMSISRDSFKADPFSISTINPGGDLESFTRGVTKGC